MRVRSLLGTCLTVPLLAAALGAREAPAAETVRAYVLVEAESGDLDPVRQALSSLGNCKALTASVWPAELIAHVQCDGSEHLTRTLADDLAGAPGVRRASVLAIIRE